MFSSTHDRCVITNLLKPTNILLYLFFFGMVTFVASCVLNNLFVFSCQANLLILHVLFFEVNFLLDVLLLGHEDFLDDLFLLCDDLHLQIVVTTDLVSLAIFCGGDKLAILKVSLAPLEGLILLQNLFEIVVVVLPVVCKQLRIRCSNLLVFMVLNRVFRVCYYLLKFFDSIT